MVAHAGRVAAPNTNVAVLVASALVAGAILLGLFGRNATAPPKGPVEQIDLDPGQAAAVLRTQLSGPQCDALLFAGRFTSDRQFVTIDVPSLGRFEVQQRKRGEFTVQPRSAIASVEGCRWDDTRIPTDPLR
jgi:hypothetical protein